MNKLTLNQCLPYLEKELLEEFESGCSVKHFSAGDYIVKQGQLIRFLPIVLDGSIKVFSNEESIQFLLYYITAGDPCVFSFAHTLNEGPSEFSAMAESDSDLLLLPSLKVETWLEKYTSFNKLILKAYQRHYNDLLNTTKQITCYNLEERLLKYLQVKVEIEGSNLLKVTHQEIAFDLGTSREVISRLMKKVSVGEKVVQVGRKIKVL